MAAATDATLAEIATSPEETVTSPEEIATSPEETDTEVVEIAEEEEIVGVRREDPRQGDRLPGGNTQGWLFLCKDFHDIELANPAKVGLSYLKIYVRH